MRRVFAASALVAVASVGAGCSDEGDGDRDAAAAGQPAPLQATVEISDAAYRPAGVKVLVGGSVTFVNRDETLPHTAQTPPSTSDTPWDDEYFFDTHALSWGEPYTVTLHKPGRLQFFCSFHNDMKGTVEIVERNPPR